MVNDAEKYKQEDEAQREKITAKNGLESYCFIIKKCQEVQDWLDANALAEKEEFDDKQKELEGVCNPIITKLYQGAGGAGGMPDMGGMGGMPGGFPGDAAPGGGAPSGGSGPTIEEVD